MRCSKCGSENPLGKKFCGDCGGPLGNPCPKCSADNPVEKRFCGECGAALVNAARANTPQTSLAQPSATGIRVTAEQSDASPAIDGERKTVTILFADIKGSMELIEDLDPEEARAIVDPALKLMMDAVHRYGGYVAQSTGDGIFALFGAPVAHEDHPQRALYATLRMQEDLKRYSDKLRERGEPPISIRVGVNIGEVVVRTIKTGETHTEYAPIGHSVSLASRLQALASHRVDRDQRCGAQAGRGLLHAEGDGAGAHQGGQRAGRGVRSDRARPDTHAAAALCWTGVHQVRRTRTRDTGNRTCRRTGEGGKGSES